MTSRYRRRVYPTGNFIGLISVLAAMWYAASSLNNGAVYLLLFALAAVALVSIPHTILNLGGLKVTVEAIKPTFAGQEVDVPIEIANETRGSRLGLVIHAPEHAGADAKIDEIAGNRAARRTLRFTAATRGEHELGQLCLTTIYPLGFVRMAKQLSLSQRYVVYPKPGGDPTLPADLARSHPHSPQRESGEGDDFAGVRAYVPGESQRHIDWKAVARGQALMTKQFAVETGGALYVDLAEARGNDLEARLSQMALWVIEAERARRPYGFRLPNIEIAPSLGEAHFHRCLRALAVFR